MKQFFVAAALAGLAWSAEAAATDPPPIASFAALPAIADVAISPDGRYLSLIRASEGRRVAVVIDRSAPGGAPRAVVADPVSDFQLTWCRWANERRLVCSFRASARELGGTLAVTRLAAVDADGKNGRALLQGEAMAEGQFQDQVLAWNAGSADTVLIQVNERVLDGVERSLRPGSDRITGVAALTGYPSIFELNVVTGRLTLRERGRVPMLRYIADRTGRARLAMGYEETSGVFSFYARLEGRDAWQRLAKFEPFAAANVLRPFAIDPKDANRAYALGAYEGRDALWSVDLTDRDSPRPVFVHPVADVGAPIFAKDGRLLGVRYDTDRPFIHYIDARIEGVAEAARKALPDRHIEIVDIAADDSLYVLRATSDVDAGTWYLLDTRASSLRPIGTAYPQLKPESLVQMKPVSYTARDGTRIPGYLTTPRGVRAEKLPLVVLPHDGPIARDDWEFDHLVQFLASRGYGVLQMNFRGSSGYGDAWFQAAHQDWGGLTYTDIIDGAKWAVATGIADPQRICIVGRGFGGYAALLAAARDGALFRCAVSVGGISDLTRFVRQKRRFLGYEYIREQVGTDPQKLARDSPRRQAAAVQTPILLVHGDRDWQMDPEQSNEMAAALEAADKPYELLMLPGADHEISREADRVRLLEALERFLAEHMR